MATRVEPQVTKDIERYGAEGIVRCFNCGNCTAVCPLSDNPEIFPRKLIRYAQLGMKERLTSAVEPWLCYYCAECSATCPREATPGETMAALRRYAVAHYDVTGLSRLLFKNRFWNILVTIALGLLLAFFHLSIRIKDGYAPAHWAVFKWIPYEAIHMIGIVAGIFFALAIVVGFLNARRRMTRERGGPGWLKQFSFAQKKAALVAVFKEIALMKRHGECETPDHETANRPWFLRPRAVHWTIMWGFFCLLAATTLDFFFVFVLGIEFYLIARILGIVGGLLMLYGVSIFSWRRFKGEEPSMEHTTFSDGWLLVFLLILDITGFLLLAVTTFQISGPFSDFVLLLHSVMAMELVLLLIMTKLAHLVYRPLALYLHFLGKEPLPETP